MAYKLEENKNNVWPHDTWKLLSEETVWFRLYQMEKVKGLVW